MTINNVAKYKRKKNIGRSVNFILKIWELVLSSQLLINIVIMLASILPHAKTNIMIMLWYW